MFGPPWCATLDLHYTLFLFWAQKGAACHDHGGAARGEEMTIYDFYVKPVTRYNWLTSGNEPDTKVMAELSIY